MKNFNFKDVLYHYNISIHRGKIEYVSYTLLLDDDTIGSVYKTEEEYLNDKSSGEFYVERWSKSPNDIKMVNEMKMELYQIYDNYIKKLDIEKNKHINIKNDLFKNELRQQKINSIKKRDN